MNGMSREVTPHEECQINDVGLVLVEDKTC